MKLRNILLTASFFGALGAFAALPNRTTKKIIPTDQLTAPYYSIQILALRFLPQDPEFFENISETREITCTDGLKRYIVGQYETESEAVAALPSIQKLGAKYAEAFVVNTQLMPIKKGLFNTAYKKEEPKPVQTEKTKETKKIKEKPISENEKKIEKPYNNSKVTKVDPNGTYVVQLTASRYPFYVSEIKEFKGVLEFYMPSDEIYRYTSAKLKGSEAEAELQRAIKSGYKDAVIIDYQVYKAFQIE